MPVLDISPNTNPQAAGTLQFYRDGMDPNLSGFSVDTSGNATFAGTVTAAAVSTTTTPVYTGASASSVVLAAQVTGDTQQRFQVLADGTLHWGSGSATWDVNLYRYAANGLATDDALKLTAGTLLLGPAGDATVARTAGGNVGSAVNIAASTAGKGFQVAEGSNCKQGTAVLAAGTVVVANTSVTANSRIFLTTQAPGGTVGAPYVSARTAGTSFTITSTSNTDTSTVAYLIMEPAA